MTTLEKIIYIADYIEPNRSVLPEMDIIRKEAYTNLDKCMLHILYNSMQYLCKKGSVLDPVTKETYEYYKQIIDQ